MPYIRAAIIGIAAGLAFKACSGGGDADTKKVDEAAPPTVEQNGVKLPPPTCMGKPVPEEKRCDMI